MNKTIKSIIDIIKSCDDVQLCTFGLEEYPETRHVMNGMNQNIDYIDLHFLTMKSSPKFKQLEKNNNCCLYYFNPTTRYAVRLFGKMKQLPSIFPSEQYFCATCLRNGIISFGFVCKDKAWMCHIISQSRNYFKKFRMKFLQIYRK